MIHEQAMLRLSVHSHSCLPATVTVTGLPGILPAFLRIYGTHPLIHLSQIYIKKGLGRLGGSAVEYVTLHFGLGHGLEVL